MVEVLLHLTPNRWLSPDGRGVHRVGAISVLTTNPVPRFFVSACDLGFGWIAGGGLYLLLVAASQAKVGGSKRRPERALNEIVSECVTGLGARVRRDGVPPCPTPAPESQTRDTKIAVPPTA